MASKEGSKWRPERFGMKELEKKEWDLKGLTGLLGPPCGVWWGTLNDKNKISRLYVVCRDACLELSVINTRPSEPADGALLGRCDGPGGPAGLGS